MPEDSNTSSGDTPGTKPEGPKVRRISNKPARKKAGDPAKKEAVEKETEAIRPEAEATADELGGGKPDQKRSNRRRRGKGKSGTQNLDQTKETESPAEASAEIPDTAEGARNEKPASREQPNANQRPPQPPRRKPDPEKVARNAWKIYLAEVSEEGVALIGDNDARELARRCFRLSEIFLEEADRRG